jgi:hypothetical protein
MGVAHHSSTVFGPDPDTFRPERWPDSDADQLADMDRYFMSALTLGTSESPGVTSVGGDRSPPSCKSAIILLRSLDHVIAHTWCCTVWHGSSQLLRKECRTHGPEQGKAAASAAF